MSYLTTSDVAKLRGTDRVAAWRWLSRNAGRHFSRKGRCRVISEDAYRRLAMAEYVDDKLARLVAKVGDLQDQLADQTRRIDTLVRRVATIRDR